MSSPSLGQSNPNPFAATGPVTVLRHDVWHQTSILRNPSGNANDRRYGWGAINSERQHLSPSGRPRISSPDATDGRNAAGQRRGYRARCAYPKTLVSSTGSINERAVTSHGYPAPRFLAPHSDARDESRPVTLKPQSGTNMTLRTPESELKG